MGQTDNTALKANRIIKTDRLILRPLTLSDADELYLVYSNVEAMRYWDTPPHGSVSDTRAMIDTMRHEKACWWTIGRQQHNRAIGAVGYLGNLGVPGMEYILHPDSWRQGYMTEAVQAALDYGFAELQVDRVELWITEDNFPSQQLAQKIGFIRRGRFRQKYQHHQASHDKIVYGMHSSEWRRPAEKTSYPQPHHQLYSLQPVLAVDDVMATAEYYRDQLGFTIDFLYGDPPTHGAVSCGQWTTESARIQLTQATADARRCASVTLYIMAGPDIDGLFEWYRARGVQIERPIASHPWGMREFAVQDCNGYVLRFGTPV